MTRIAICCIAAYLAFLVFGSIAKAQSFQMPMSVPCIKVRADGAVTDPKWGEKVIGRALFENGAMFNLYLNSETKTFTLVAVHADGTACFLGSGKHYQEVVPPLKKESTY